ncbi:hypothetical protein [Levilactobacillus bambusae]|uniref:Uncharacterized protein n=1 Tax=Levilactobacillus bambusae TaxID=2024736 RepID=A0A2V1N0G4_9LACO|nr:hypothetical protein [Levilactobacillus bambusae]PWG00704.1 hypothetical protein DCM90_00580 [Levilactobacillus bambusae]
MSEWKKFFNTNHVIENTRWLIEIGAITIDRLAESTGVDPNVLHQIVTTSITENELSEQEIRFLNIFYYQKMEDFFHHTYCYHHQITPNELVPEQVEPTLRLAMNRFYIR